MLANAYLPAIMAIFGAGASLVLAILLELPILRLVWRRPWLRLAGWVLAANLVSAGVGIAALWNNTGPGMTADPLAVNRTWLQTYATRVTGLLVLTLILEGLVYLALNRGAKSQLRAGRLLGGLFVGNFASYGVLAGLVLSGMRPDGSTTLLPDTGWLSPTVERIWFVEPGTHHLCSIRLDGTDRRTEVAEPLGRFETGFYDVSLYAVVPERQSFAFVASDGQWRLAEPEGTRSLGLAAPRTSRRALDGIGVSGQLPQVLKATGLSKTPRPRVWSNVLPRTCRPVFMKDEAGEWSADTVIAGGGGSGYGLTVGSVDARRTVRIPAGPAFLACCEPAVLPDRGLVVFRCSAWIMVMDIATGRVGRVAEGDSLVAAAPVYATPRQ